jgi:LCP family protein required for cell wall assembly
MKDSNKSARRLDGPGRPISAKSARPGQSDALSRPTEVIAGPVEATDQAGNLNEIDLGEVSHRGVVAGSLSQSQSRTSRFGWLRHISRKRAAVGVLLLCLITVGVVGVKAVLATQRVITKAGEGAPALRGEVDPAKLKGEGDGRINILLLGVGGDGHAGGTLSDTIMVASIDPINKTIAMLSIPRDLYVKIPGYGYGKINSANSSGGPELAMKVVGGILDLPIHYYMQADFSGFKQAVDAVGGVNINNQTKLSDSAFPCDNDKGYCPFNLAVGQYHMDGKIALKFARCRHGSCGDDFGRAARQQQLLTALRQKALDASTLTNPVKISGLIDSVGAHVRTDLQLNELQKLAVIIKDIDTSKNVTKVLDDTPTGLLVEGGNQFPGAGSILLPKAGSFDYSDIQELAHSIFVDGYIQKENASIEIQNGTTRDGLGAAVSKQLKAYSYNITNVRSADLRTYATSQIIDYTGGKKPYTSKYLQTRFGAAVQQVTRPASTTPNQDLPDIVIIVGNNYKPTTQ